MSGGRVFYFWDWSIYRKFWKNCRISFLDDCRSIAAWVMEKMLREKIWEGNSAVEEFSTSIFTPMSESGCYGIADGHRCHAGVSVRAELHRRSMLEWLTSSELYWPTSERTHTHRACRDSIWGSEGEKREWECVGTLHEFIKNGKQTLRWEKKNWMCIGREQKKPCLVILRLLGYS